MKPLADKTALVAGASRGAGRGIAYALGEAGATVYVTGRSVRGAITDNRNECIEETAQGVDARGGRGVAIRCDHTDEEDVKALFGRIAREQTHLDLLVNSAFGGSEDSLPADEGPSFWQRPFSLWDAMMSAPKSCFLTSRYALPLLFTSERALIVNVTFFMRDQLLGDLYYDVAMNAVNRATLGMAQELKARHVAAIALCPGWMRTERVTDAGFGPADGAAESTAYIGRAVAALAADPLAARYTGCALTVAELAEHYGFTDTDGTQPPAYE